MKEYYEVLGVPRGASWHEVRAAYRSQVKQWHPDRFRYDDSLYAVANEKTKAINQAYAVLADYHRTLDQSTGSFSPHPEPKPQPSTKENVDARWMGYTEPPPACEDFGISQEEYRYYSNRHDKEHWRFILTWAAIPSTLFVFMHYTDERSPMIALLAASIAAAAGASVYVIMTGVMILVSKLNPKHEQMRQYKRELANWGKRQDKAFWDRIRGVTS